VKYLKFTCNHLVSANIPVQSPEEQFDYDRMTHLRYILLHIVWQVYITIYYMIGVYYYILYDRYILLHIV